MNRYAQTSQNDQPALTERDVAFLGADSYTSKENLPSGVVQAATNIDFSDGAASTRGGFVCLPELGSAYFNVASPWTQQTSALARDWLSVAYGNGRFVTMGATTATTNDAMYSTDSGVTWNLASTGNATSWNSITYGNSLFAAVGGKAGSTSCIATSPDGVTWTVRTAPAGLVWTAITYNNGTFVAVASSGTTNQVMTSADGVTWTGRTSPTELSGSNWQGIVYGNSTFVAVHASGSPSGRAAMTSTDNGVTWTVRDTPLSAYLAVGYGNSTFVAVSSVGGTSQAMTSSDDGVTWTSRTTLSASNRTWRSIAYGNGLFVSVNSDGTASTAIMSSPNGVTWTAQTAPSSQLWYGVAHGSNTFVATPTSAAATLMTKSFSTTPNTTGAVLASGTYSDPNDAGSRWTMLVGTNKVGFYAFGKATRTVNINSSYTVTEQATVVQCNNQVYIFRGFDDTPLYWDGNWGNQFTAAPSNGSPGAGFSGTPPNSNQAIYYQNRLWVKEDKDTVAASDVLDFTKWDDIANDFNLNTGSSDYLVTSYPFGDNTLIVFKNNSILALNNVQGGLSDVTATEITRTVGCIGINAVTSVGPDLVYVSDRNINLLSLTSTNNAVQHKTLPLSRALKSIWRRVNWEYGYKISLAFWDNKLFVALPLDNATVCNTVCAYNFITEQWYGEWNFDSSISMNVQGWVIATYLGEQRLHCITEDGRIFVTDEGAYDISGTIVADISTSVTTRAFRMDDNTRLNRRVWIDIGTNRPEFSVTAYSDGVGESDSLLTSQTFARSESWIFGDSTYSLTNSGDNYNRAGRKDYAGLCSESIQAQSGFLPESLQEIRMPLITRRSGRLAWATVTNTRGKLVLRGLGFEAREGYRGNYVQVL